MSLVNIGLMAVSALMLTLLLMPLSIRLARLAGAVDHPDTRKVHAADMPRLGGLAIGIAFVAVCLLSLSGSPEVLALMVGAVVIVLTGLADDIWQIRPWQKFVGEIIGASLFVSLSGVQLENLGNLMGTGPITTGSFAFPFTVFAIVGVVNALNLSDGLDGLAGGLSAVACLFLGYFAFMSHDWACLSVIVILFSCLMGFLYYNAYPAKVFMGDAGSLTLGFVLVSVAVLLAGKDTGVQPISMPLILALPTVDTLLVMTQRLLHGLSPFLPDRTHLHHRLLNMGFSHAAVIPILYSVMALFGFVAILMMGQPEWLQLGVGLGLSACLYGLVIFLPRFGFRWQGGSSEGKARAFEYRIFQQLTALSGRSIPMMTRLIPVLLAFPILSIQTFVPSLPALCLIIGVSILMLFPWSARENRAGFGHGLIYINVFCLLAIYAVFAPPWVSDYFTIVSALVMSWVVIKLVFKRHGRVFLTSGFEMLMIIISWLFPVFLGSALSISAQTEEALYVVCLQSIPFLLAMKIVIRRQVRRNRPLAACLVGILLLIGVRGLV